MSFDAPIVVRPAVQGAVVIPQSTPNPGMPASRTSSSVYRGVLDQIGCGVVVVDAQARLRYANPAAMRAFGGPMTLSNGLVIAANPDDREALLRAVARASAGLRTMVCLSSSRASTAVAVLPLPGVGAEENSVLMLLGREDSADPLVVQLFARDHALTDAECRVLHMLCTGTRPNVIASELGVALSTVRTHLQTIRSKTCTSSLFELVRRVAMLPPMASALANGGAQQRGVECPAFGA